MRNTYGLDPVALDRWLTTPPDDARYLAEPDEYLNTPPDDDHDEEEPMTAPDACTCHPAVQLRALLAQASAHTLAHLAADEIDVDASSVFGSTFRCPSCGAHYLVNILVTTLPRP
jgi:hypothetical protein